MIRPLLTGILAGFCVTAIALCITGFVNGQQSNFISFDKWTQDSTIDGKLKEGVYFVAITADWCEPCQRLKKRLASEFKSETFVVIDYEHAFAIPVREASDGMLPLLVRYDMKSGVLTRKFWNRQSDLKQFLSRQQK